MCSSDLPQTRTNDSHHSFHDVDGLERSYVHTRLLCPRRRSVSINERFSLEFDGHSLTSYRGIHLPSSSSRSSTKVAGYGAAIASSGVDESPASSSGAPWASRGLVRPPPDRGSTCVLTPVEVIHRLFWEQLGFALPRPSAAVSG